VTPTNGRKPKTGDKRLLVQFRNGQSGTYTAAQLRWTDTGSDFDAVAVEVLKEGKHGQA
jgi:hypothetical protein